MICFGLQIHVLEASYENLLSVLDWRSNKVFWLWVTFIKVVHLVREREKNKGKVEDEKEEITRVKKGLREKEKGIERER